MNMQSLVAAAAVAVIAVPHPESSHSTNEPQAQALPATGKHPDHIELEAVELGLALKVERELRPTAQAPFGNRALFSRPIEQPWQPQSQVWGPPLALLAAARSEVEVAAS